MRLLPILSVVVLLLFAAIPAWATGDPSITITFVPLAVSKEGKVLFRVVDSSNQSGGNGYSPGSSFHYVVVSSKKIWVEVNGREGDDSVFFYEAGYREKIETEHSGRTKPIDWGHMSPILASLVREHGLKKGDEVPANLGEGLVEWTPEGLRKGGVLVTRFVPQRTLYGNLSSEGPQKGHPVACFFFAAGVATFRNRWNAEFPFAAEDHYAFGASWAIGEDFSRRIGKPDPWTGAYRRARAYRDDWYGSVDGVCIVPAGDKVP